MEKNWREKEFLSVKDIAGIMSVSRDSAMRIMRSLPFVHTRGGYRLRTVYLEKMIRDEERKRCDKKATGANY